MKLRPDKNRRSIAITVFVVAAALIVLIFVVMHLPAIGGFIAKCFSLLKPVFYGILFAYLLTPLVRMFEDQFLTKLGRKLFPHKAVAARRFSRSVGIGLSLGIVLACLAILLILIVPKLVTSAQTLLANLTVYIGNLQDWLIRVIPDGFPFAAQIHSIGDKLLDLIMGFSVEVTDTAALRELGAKIFSSIYAVGQEVLYVIVGIVVSIYVLAAKERFAAEAKKILYAVFPVKGANLILKGCRETNQIFGGFLVGKIIDSLIIGVICFVILLICDMPYKELVSIIVGITNIIPFFGPFIGAIPSFLIIALVDPVKGMWFLLIIFLLQQFDGNILGPKILGQKLGIGSLWIIVAVLLGGGLFGFPGMIFGVPVMAMIYQLIKWLVERRLKKKQLPATTWQFRHVRYIDPEDNLPCQETSTTLRGTMYGCAPVDSPAEETVPPNGPDTDLSAEEPAEEEEPGGSPAEPAVSEDAVCSAGRDVPSEEASVPDFEAAAPEDGPATSEEAVCEPEDASPGPESRSGEI